MLTHTSRPPPTWNHQAAIDRHQALHAAANEQNDAIKKTSSAIEDFVAAERQFLFAGLSILAPGVTTLEPVENPGSIEEICRDLHGSIEHMEERLERLARSTIYRLCQVIDQVRLPLERLLVATRGWQQDKDHKWLRIRPEKLTSNKKTERLIDATMSLKQLIPRQRKQLTRLANDFTLMAKVIQSDGKLLKLYEQGMEAQKAIRMVMEKHNLLDPDDATQEAVAESLVTAIHRDVSLHRPAIIPLIEMVEGIASHESNSVVLDFLDRIVREKQKIDNAILSTERKLKS